MLCGKRGKGTFVSPLHDHHWTLDVSVHVPLFLLCCFRGCRHVLSITHYSSCNGGANLQEFRCQQWTCVESVSLEIIAHVGKGIHQGEYYVGCVIQPCTSDEFRLFTIVNN